MCDGQLLHCTLVVLCHEQTMNHVSRITQSHLLLRMCFGNPPLGWVAITFYTALPLRLLVFHSCRTVCLKDVGFQFTSQK